MVAHHDTCLFLFEVCGLNLLRNIGNGSNMCEVVDIFRSLLKIYTSLSTDLVKHDSHVLMYIHRWWIYINLGTHTLFHYSYFSPMKRFQNYFTNPALFFCNNVTLFHFCDCAGLTSQLWHASSIHCLPWCSLLAQGLGGGGWGWHQPHTFCSDWRGPGGHSHSGRFCTGLDWSRVWSGL